MLHLNDNYERCSAANVSMQFVFGKHINDIKNQKVVWFGILNNIVYVLQ